MQGVLGFYNGGYEHIGFTDFASLPGQEGSNTGFSTFETSLSSYETSPLTGLWIVITQSPVFGWFRLIGPGGQWDFQAVANVTALIPEAAGVPMEGEWTLVAYGEEQPPVEPENEWSSNIRVSLLDSQNMVRDVEDFTVDGNASEWDYPYPPDYDNLGSARIRKIVIRSTDGKALRPGSYKVYYDINNDGKIMDVYGISDVPDGNTSIYAPVIHGNWFGVSPDVIIVEFNGSATPGDPPDPQVEEEEEPDEVSEDVPSTVPQEIPEVLPAGAECACSPWYSNIAEMLQAIVKQLKWTNERLEEVTDVSGSQLLDEIKTINTAIEDGKLMPFVNVENNSLSVDGEMEINEEEEV